MAWNRPTSNTGNATSSSRPSGRGKMPRLHRGLIAGVIVVLGAGLAAWLICPSSATNNRQPTTSNRSRIRDVKPATMPKPATLPMTNVTDKTPEETYLGRKVVKRVETTNETGRVKIVVTTDDGQTHRYYRTGQARRIFKFESDYALANLLSTPEGATPAPYPISPGLDEAFKASLMNPIEDDEDDTDEDRALKERVRQARLDAVDLMNQGFTFTQILTEHQAQARENSEVALSVAKEAKKILEEYGAEEASKYVTKINEALKRMGIGPIKDIGLPGSRGAQKEETK